MNMLSKLTKLCVLYFRTLEDRLIPPTKLSSLFLELVQTLWH